MAPVLYRRPLECEWPFFCRPGQEACRQGLFAAVSRSSLPPLSFMPVPVLIPKPGQYDRQHEGKGIAENKHPVSCVQGIRHDKRQAGCQGRQIRSAETVGAFHPVGLDDLRNRADAHDKRACRSHQFKYTSCFHHDPRPSACNTLPLTATVGYSASAPVPGSALFSFVLTGWYLSMPMDNATDASKNNHAPVAAALTVSSNSSTDFDEM